MQQTSLYDKNNKKMQQISLILTCLYKSDTGETSGIFVVNTLCTTETAERVAVTTTAKQYVDMCAIKLTIEVIFN